jgi:anaerobic selenocysteine-containing dehydrogenase
MASFSSPLAPAGAGATHEIRGACPHDCPDTCALVTTVREGVAIKVQGNPAHRPTDGVLCTKVSRYTRAQLPPRAPAAAVAARRPQGSGRFVLVSWDDALADIAARLTAIAGRDPQPSCLTAIAGPWAWCRARAWRRASSTSWVRRCWTARSAPAPAAEGLTQTLGGKVGMKVEFFAESKLILIWGSNSITSNLHFLAAGPGRQRNGAKLVCIDPRRSETAEKCHEHVHCGPARSGAGPGPDAAS